MEEVDESSLHWLQLHMDYMVDGHPFLFPSSSTSSWSALSDWVREDGTPNLEYLQSEYGSLRVPVVVDGECEPVEMTLSEYMKYVRGDRDRMCYLKDWHLQQSAGTSFYTPPSSLRPDWVNREDWTSTVVSPFDGADYRFVYFGVKDTWTGFHSDVVSSHSWSANVCGRKLWMFVPRGVEKEFTRNGQLTTDLRDDEGKWKRLGGFSVIQEPGQIMFVPSNWHHQVHNLEDTISINHNVINASNVSLVFSFLSDRLKDVKAEIGHLRNVFEEDEMNEKEKLILKADARLNFDGLSTLCRLVIDSRMKKDRDCYVCYRHADVTLCRFGSRPNDCRPLPCDCTTEQCKECTRLYEEFELTVAATVIYSIHK